MSKYVKVMFGSISGANRKVKYKIDEVNVCDNWNPNATKGRDFGGFNYATDDCILRWLHRGDTIYDVEIPNDAENVKIEGATDVYRTNKIIIKNPRKIDDDLALHFYKISGIPKKSYYKALGGVSIMNYKKTALAILRDKVNKNNIDIVLEEWNDFINHGGKNDRSNELVNLIDEYLTEIKSNLLISICVDKDPYIKQLTNDKVINITGESGSGKSTFLQEYLSNDNYIVIDTDEIKDNRLTNNKYCLEFREYLKNKYEDKKLDIYKDFNIIYKEILEFYNNIDKTLIIDSAQFRNLRTDEDFKLLKGKVIVIRTCIDTCLDRCINRWKLKNKNYTEEELEDYINRKQLYKRYKNLNKFLEMVDKM